MKLKFNVVGKRDKVKVIDILNINGIRILVLEMYGKYYILAYNNNSIILLDKLENIELSSPDFITNKPKFNKYLEKIFENNFTKNIKD
ncbi:hypothetical protein [Caloranaerobacter azorensis]|uniref:Uncharacterized protein n=1 Tax=Caloranaerobacter azorensis TaxID=116090 RepID=A0A6P1YBB0_9FIRM|nr:hypothetical protein [Caloranaerobacter azorensis]QIB26182.1 hypothetical protein G3A45_01975 [Caloranaerobacter azorensis]